MKFILTPDEHKDLADPLKGEYKEQDGSFVLSLEGHEDTFVPKSKKDLAESHRREAEKKLEEATARQEELLSQLESASGKKEIEEIRTNAAAEIDKVKAEYATKEAEQKAENNRSLLATEAAQFAGEKFTIPSLIQDAYAKRLTVEEVGDKQVIRVLEADGTASPKSIADLQKEFLDNAEYAPIIKAAQSSGGSADKNKSGDSGSATKQVEFTKENKAAAVEAVKARLVQQGVITSTT